jgi:uncharacterized protein YchJ
MEIRQDLTPSCRFVEFCAYYFLNNCEYELREISKFQFDTDRWYYTGQKIAKKRNYL